MTQRKGVDRTAESNGWIKKGRALDNHLIKTMMGPFTKAAYANHESWSWVTLPLKQET